MFKKRLSFTNELAPSPAATAGPSSPSSPSKRSTELPPTATPTTSGFPFPHSAPPPPSIERGTLHKSLAALAALLEAVDELRDVGARMAKAEKRVGKAVKELALTFQDKSGGSDIIASTLTASERMMGDLADVDLKTAKQVQASYESVNSVASKFFKQVAKEEKAYDDNLSNLDSKVQKANASYDKNRRTSPRPTMSTAANLTASHDTYIATLSTLSATISSVKSSHASSMGALREKALKTIAKGLSGLAETSWRSRVEGAKKGGPGVGELIERAMWCEVGMPNELEDEEPEEKFVAQQSPTTSNGGTNGAVLQRTTSTLRGPRPLPSSQEAYPLYSQQQSQQAPQQVLDSGVLASLPANTYLVQIPQFTQHTSTSLQSLQAVPPPSTNGQALSSHHNQTRSVPPPPPPPRRQSIAASLERQVEELERSVDQPRGGTKNTAYSSSLTSHTLSPFASEDSSMSRSPPVSMRSSSQGIVPPRGFVLDDESVVSPIVEKRETNWGEEVLRSSPLYGYTEEQSRREREGKREQEDGRQERPAVQRAESTASERNFVAKMKEKYAEERPRQEERSEPPPAGIPRSSSRVSTLAARYSKNVQPQETEPTSPSYDRPRPTHRYTQSMTPLTSRPSDFPSTAANEFGQRSPWAGEPARGSSSTTYGSPPAAGLGVPGRPFVDEPRSYSRQSSGSRQGPSDDSQRMGGRGSEHSEVCGCPECSAKNYRNTSARGGDEERRLQEEFRSVGRVGGDKRLSMPAIFGGRK
ncbi:hypothetical protein MNV49_006901 [Pseudohyphozyma bogoriensis]|nr:hypothetical protein MNV49_006901 [Pseudohyphozyma bogoriensis]